MTNLDTKPPANRKSFQWLLMSIGGIIVTACLVCCGGPIALYFIATRTIEARLEAPATPEPLKARELLDWYNNNRPSQSFVLHDTTRDNVDFRGTIKEINVGRELRVAARGGAEFRKRIEDSVPNVQERLASWGQAQLVFHGEQDNQEVICWFVGPEMTEGLSIGEEVVIRGRFGGRIEFPIISYTDKGPVEVDGGFSYNLQKCRVISK